MGQRMLRSGGLIGVAAAAAFIAAAVPAAAADAPGNSSAYGISVNTTLLNQDLVNVGPTPSVKGADGPNTKSVVDLSALNIPPNLLTADTLKATANQDTSTGESSASATVQNVTLPALKQALGAVPTIDVIKATCEATTPGQKPTLNTTIASADLGKLANVDVSNIAPDTKVALAVGNINVATLILNEQVDNGGGSWTVNAVHLKVLGGALGDIASGDVVISSATCGPASEGNGGGTTPPTSTTDPPGNNGGGDNGGGDTTPAANNGGSGNGGVADISQVTKVPQGAADTGYGSTAGVEEPWVFGLGGALVLAAGGALALRRRLGGQR